MLTAEVGWHCVVHLSNFKYAAFRSDFDAVTVQQTAGRRWLGLIRSLLAALSTRWGKHEHPGVHKMKEREPLNMFQHLLTLCWHLDGS